MMNLDQVRVIDPILTQLAQGYKNAEGVATFFAPAVSMNTRAGRTLVFGKEAFAAQSFLRAPGTNIQKIQNQFGTRSFALRQEAISWEIAEEVAAEAKNGAAQIDLRQFAAKDAANRLMQSWEVQVATAVTDTAQYETNNVLNLATYNGGADQFNSPTADVDRSSMELLIKIPNTQTLIAAPLLRVQPPLASNCFISVTFPKDIYV
jgi:hypothetical protein